MKTGIVLAAAIVAVAVLFPHQFQMASDALGAAVHGLLVSAAQR